MDKFSFVGNADVNAIEALYQQYLANPESVDATWAQFFQGFDFAKAHFDSEVPDNVLKEFKVLGLIDAYRKRGHLFTKTNPVRERRDRKALLDIEDFGLDQNDLNTEFQAGKEIGIGTVKLSKLIESLKICCYNTFPQDINPNSIKPHSLQIQHLNKSQALYK